MDFDDGASSAAESETPSDGEFRLPLLRDDDDASLSEPFAREVHQNPPRVGVVDQAVAQEDLKWNIELMQTKAAQFKDVAERYGPISNVHIVVSLVTAFLFFVFLVGTPLGIAIAWVFAGWKEEALWLFLVGSLGTAFTFIIHLVLRPFDRMFAARNALFAELQQAAKNVLDAVHTNMMSTKARLARDDVDFESVAKFQIKCDPVVHQPLPTWWFIIYPFWFLWGLFLVVPFSLAFDVRSAFGVFGSKMLENFDAADAYFKEQFHTFSNAVSYPFVSQIFSHIRRATHKALPSFSEHIRSICEAHPDKHILLVPAPIKKRGRALVKIQDEYLAETFGNQWWINAAFITTPITWGVAKSIAILKWFASRIFHPHQNSDDSDELDGDPAAKKAAKRPLLLRLFSNLVVRPFLFILMLGVMQVTLTLNLATVLLALPVVLIRTLLLVPVLPIVAQRSATRLGDVGRAMVVCNSLEEIAFIHRKLVAASDSKDATWRIVRFKNRFAPTDDGFVELLYNMQQITNGKPGVICELQITHQDFYKQRTDAHAPYKLMRAKNPVLLYKDLVIFSRTELLADLTTMQDKNSSLRAEIVALKQRIEHLENELAQLKR